MAYDKAKELAGDTISLRYKDASGDERMVWMDGNWTVVGQDPSAGTPAHDGVGVDVLLLKNDEADEAVSAYFATDPHDFESPFTGTISAYSPDHSELNMLVVDGAVLTLDLVYPIGAGCTSGSWSEARAARDALLPLGAEVIVARTRGDAPDAMVHVLEESGELVEEPPAGTANEHLVRTGWWQPSSLAFEGGFVPDFALGAAFTPYTSGSDLTNVQAWFAQSIITAGNEAVEGAVAGAGMCRAQSEADSAAFIAAREAEDERQRRWIAEFERREAEGYYDCRDGDGDGVCFER